ncbi:MAG: ABC transporter permease subunit [Gammaproteobacteria bacterium]|nr:ABC transporter permease subunit [Gammaproteobacteria bacterium]
MKPWQQWITLIRFDLITQQRERGTWLLLGVVVLMAWCGVWQGAIYSRDAARASANALAQADTARTAAAQYATNFFANPDTAEAKAARSFRNVADIRGYAFREHIAFARKPVAPSAALSIGQSDILPSYVRVRAESMDSVRFSNEIEHPKRLAVGRFDLMFVVLYLWPLVLLSLAITILTSDRESKRLDLLRLQGVKTANILLAQLAGRATAATVIFITMVSLPLFALGIVPRDLGGMIVLCQWAGVTFVLSLFWTGVAAFICARCKTRANAAFTSFSAWVVIALVLPQLLAAAVSAISPMPSREMYLLQMREAVDKVNADRVNMVQRFYDQHPEWRPLATPLDKVAAPVVRLARAAALEKLIADSDAAFAAARAKQASLLANLQWLSPVTVAHTAYAQIAGNDSARHDLF